MTPHVDGIAADMSDGGDGPHGLPDETSHLRDRPPDRAFCPRM